MKLNGLCLLLSIHSQIVKAENWSTAFDPKEIEGTIGWGTTLFSISFLVQICCTFTAIGLFLASGKRATAGDYYGATMSFAGAVCVAIAPTLII